MAIKIITDSASDLPQNIAQKYGIEVLPLLVFVNDQEYLDGVTLSPDALYKAMKEGASVKTAQIPLNFFVERFTGYAQEDHHRIYLAFSSKLSGTYQTAVLAYEMVKETHPEFEMTIVDTKCVSLGLGLMAIQAAKMVEDAGDYASVMAFVNKAMTTTEHVFSVDDLTYLFRGGRVSKSQALMGNLLNIKPILKVEAGALVPFDKVKGRKKRLLKMFDYVKTHGKSLGNQTIGIAHALNEEDALAIKEHFETVYGTKDFVIESLGCAVGAHCGPGLITLFFKTEAD